MVKRVNPKKIYTLHGFAADFAECLRELGFDARSLSEDEQMLLALAKGKRLWQIEPLRQPRPLFSLSWGRGPE